MAHSSIGVGTPQIKVFFDTPAAVAIAMMSAGCTQFEISGALYGVPCNELLEIQPNLEKKGPLVIDPNYSNILILGVVFPKQTGSAAASDFEVADADVLAQEQLTKAYPFMSGQCGKFFIGWAHTHPGNYGVTPSTTDENSFKQMSDGKPVFVMVIVDNKLSTSAFNINTDVFVKVKISGSVYGPVGFSANSNNQVVWSGSVGIYKHPFITHITFTTFKEAKGVEVEGLDPRTWRLAAPYAYNAVLKLIQDKSFTIWGYNSEEALLIPSIKEIKELVSPFSTYSNTGKTRIYTESSKKNNDDRSSYAGFKW